MNKIMIVSILSLIFMFIYLTISIICFNFSNNRKNSDNSLLYMITAILFELIFVLTVA